MIDVDPKFLLDWFLKSLLLPISKYVPMDLPQSKDESILNTQTFDRIYSQYGCLYTVLPHAPRPTSSTPPNMSHIVDGLIGFMNQ